MKTWLRIKRWKRVALVTLASVVALAFSLFLIVCWQIGVGVDEALSHAKSMHEGDGIEALLEVVNDPSETWPRRNRAVWALGQLGDSRAHEPLQRLVTGLPCDHGARLCEKELAKAVKAVDGGFNAGAWVWRGRIAGAD